MYIGEYLGGLSIIWNSVVVCLTVVCYMVDVRYWDIDWRFHCICMYIELDLELLNYFISVMKDLLIFYRIAK